MKFYTVKDYVEVKYQKLKKSDRWATTGIYYVYYNGKCTNILRKLIKYRTVLRYKLSLNAIPYSFH